MTDSSDKKLPFFIHINEYFRHFGSPDGLTDEEREERGELIEEFNREQEEKRREKMRRWQSEQAEWHRQRNGE